MERIQQILKAAKVNISDEAIEQAIKELGLDPASLSDDEAETIAQTLVEQNSGQLAISGKKSKGQIRKTRKTRKQETPHASNGLAAGLAKAAAASEEEISAIVTTLEAAKENASEVWAEEAVAIVRSAPNRTLAKIGEKCAEEVADPAHFRAVATEIGNALFASVKADATE